MGVLRIDTGLTDAVVRCQKKQSTVGLRTEDSDWVLEDGEPRHTGFATRDSRGAHNTLPLQPPTDKQKPITQQHISEKVEAKHMYSIRRFIQP